MLNKRFQSITCDGCSVANDGHFEPRSGLLPAVDGKPAPLLRPAYQQELAFFWLCRDCGPDYNYDPKQFFTEEFFDTSPYCDRCEEESVENWGHVCPECEDGII